MYINNTQSANLTEHHQTELIAMANIATEMYWREHLGIEYQADEYLEWLRMFPESEPPLPGLNDYVRNRRPQTLRDKRPVKPKFNLSLVTKNTLEDTAWQLGQKMTLKKLPGKGLRRLTSRVMIHQVFGKLAPSIWIIIHDLSKKPEHTELLIKEFLDENEALNILQASLAKSTNKTVRRLAAHWQNNQVQRTWSLIDLALGVNPNPPREFIHYTGIKEAKEFDMISPTFTPEKLPRAWVLRKTWNILSNQTRVRHNLYRAVRRAIAAKLGTQSQEAKILSKLILGAERLADGIDTRKEEMEAIIQKTGNKLALRTEDRDWSLANREMVLKPGSGAPWPAHFDAATVFQPLKNAATTEPTIEKIRDAAELKIAMADRKADQEAMLCRMIRVFTTRRTQRMQDSMKITEPEIK